MGGVLCFTHPHAYALPRLESFLSRILIVEDHALVREAMAQSLARLQAGLVCIEASGADEALVRLETDADIDLAIIDLMLPDMNGFSLLGVLAKRFPDVPAIVVSAIDDEASVRRAIKAGASGYVSKSNPGDVLLEAVRVVLAGGVHTPATRSASAPGGRRVPPSERFGLTTAQSRVLDLLASGKTNREIADLLGLSEGTVKVHVTAIFRALGVSNRAQALVVMSRSGTRL
ncbi:LuxR family DNA-binding response regulator [Thauera sp. 63]|nr:LuxR family DNA-binding response regulator [Thauera sp. 63]